MEYTLTVGDRINIVLCIFSFVLAALSIIFVILTLRQNSKMIESTTRPYISISFKAQGILADIVIRNYGSSSAVITKFRTNIDLAPYALAHSCVPLKNMVGTHFAPSEVIVSAIDAESLYVHNELVFYISYKSSTKEYSETIAINLASVKDNVTTHTSVTKGRDELYAIARALQDISDRLI